MMGRPARSGRGAPLRFDTISVHFSRVVQPSSVDRSTPRREPRRDQSSHRYRNRTTSTTDTNDQRTSRTSTDQRIFYCDHFFTRAKSRELDFDPSALDVPGRLRYSRQGATSPLGRDERFLRRPRGDDDAATADPVRQQPSPTSRAARRMHFNCCTDTDGGGRR